VAGQISREDVDDVALPESIFLKNLKISEESRGNQEGIKKESRRNQEGRRREKKILSAGGDDVAA
jgi:hypothetical protein